MPVPAWLDRIPAPVLRWLDRVTAPVLRPSRNAVRGWALALVVVNAVAIATGAAVRLSASGLGCPDWPACTKSSLVAAQSTGQTLLNSWIEFGNRLLVVSLTVIAAAAFIAFVMYKTGGQRRKDLIWLSAVQPLVVVAQAVVGGITVLAKLPPALVSAHFLLSALILLPAAVVLHVRTGEGPGPVRNLVRADLRVLAGLLVIATGAGSLRRADSPHKIDQTATSHAGEVKVVKRLRWNPPGVGFPAGHRGTADPHHPRDIVLRPAHLRAPRTQ